MDPSKLTAYRDAAKAAREFRPLPDVVYTDMLSDAVIKLVAEVERLQGDNKRLTENYEMAKRIIHSAGGICREALP